MTAKSLFLRHVFDGGWATDFGPSSDVVPDGTIVRVPFLVDADNVIYELDGAPHKAPGASRLNSSALESGADVMGIYDYWISGTSGSATQHRIVHVGTKIKKDDADGSFTDLFTGLESGKVPDYTTFDDLLIMASDSTVDVPKSWDGTTAQNLAGSPPNFAFSTVHKNRVWAAGDAANPSTLYYSGYVDPTNWTGLGSGEIQISPDDGDSITGIVSFKGQLWVFKGPYKGSIHRISGSAPTEGDPFSQDPFIEGVGAVGNNTIFRFSDDVGFMWSDGSVRSLKATAAFGDFSQVDLSRPINIYIREHFTFSSLKSAWAVNWPDLGIVLFSVPIDTATSPNTILLMDYRFPNVRWARWSSFADTCVSLASVVDSASSNRRIVMAGGTDGFVRKYGQATRIIDDATSISYRVTLPHLTYGSPSTLKTLTGGSIGIQPKNNQNITVGWTRDNNAQQTTTVTQGGTAVLGSFVLGTDTLGGARFVDRFFRTQEGGVFRSVSFEIANNVAGEDIEPHSISAKIEVGAESLEN